MAAVVESQVTLPAIPSMADAAREYVAEILAGTPRVTEAKILAFELTTVAILSGRAEFTLMVTLHGERVRIEVHDHGSAPDGCTEPAEGEAGMGIGLASLIADDMGDRHGPNGDTRWAELSWSEATP